MQVSKLRNEIELLKERNRKVEMAKDWDGSLTRILLVSVTTYFCLGIYMSVDVGANYCPYE